MTNTLLEEYLQNPVLSDKDRYEIRQIFDLVDNEKKKNILKNFPKIIAWVTAIKDDLRKNQEILIWKALSNIERTLQMAKSWWIKSWTSSSIWALKNTL